MGAQAAFSCDGPKCAVLTPRVKGERGAPHQWIRIALNAPGTDDKVEGAFHNAACAQAWVANELGVTPPLVNEKG